MKKVRDIRGAFQQTPADVGAFLPPLQSRHGLVLWPAIRMAKEYTQRKSNGGGLDFEAQLWAAADKLRGHMDASEYKHVALGLIFLKYISDAFEEKREQLLFGFSDPKSE
jgi:hypothetical protein